MKSFYISLSILLLSVVCQAHNSDVSAVENLTRRLIPEYADQFEFRQTASDDKDNYSLESKDGKILICGNNANSMAVALNHYLKRYCNTTVSWYAEIPVEMPASLPEVPSKETASARVERRFFLNYCTYGYTMPFWDWSKWERLIDWMALNGVNMPLATTGQEAVWYNIYRQLGIPDTDIRTYFTGPTYLPWNRMANIDSYNGPLPKEWLESQTLLQQQILQRERELSMKPVLPAFSGHVPSQLQTLYPNANIQYLGKWAGFDDQYRCHFLGPEEPLFAEIQRMYLEEQTRLFGTDHIYGIDPFNEVDPPSWDPEYLNEISNNIYQTLSLADPDAEWMQMSWMFYHDKKDWTQPRIKALLSGTPTGRMSLLDYHCENIELWKDTENFYGQPFIWCYLGNFGGNTTMTGNVKESGRRIDNVLQSNISNMQGIGSTLEGLDVTQFPYEYIFEKAWTSSLPDEEWVDNLADRHLGLRSESIRKAWHILFNEIYVQVPRTLGVATNFRPKFGSNPNRRTGIGYNNTRLIDAWKLLLEAPDANRDAMSLDLIITGRQVLGNMFEEAKCRLDSAFIARNIDKLKAEAAIMTGMLHDMDVLNSYHPECSLHNWINDAREYGSTPQIKDYYEHNARNLITTWGGSLNDYASRTWSGLLIDYYAKRWDIYIDFLIRSCEDGIALNIDELDHKLTIFENNWVNSTDPVQKCHTDFDLLTFSRLLFDRYVNCTVF